MCRSLERNVEKRGEKKAPSLKVKRPSCNFVLINKRTVVVLRINNTNIIII